MFFVDSKLQHQVYRFAKKRHESRWKIAGGRAKVARLHDHNLEWAPVDMGTIDFHLERVPVRPVWLEADTALVWLVIDGNLNIISG